MPKIDARFVVLETSHWIVNHRTDAWLPGYVVVAARDEAATDLDRVAPEALAELGPLLARVVRAVEAVTGAERTYVARFGHSPVWPVHFHVIPVGRDVLDALARDPRYDGVRALRAGDMAAETDGPEATLFVMRELTAGDGRPRPPTADACVADTVGRLRAALGAP